MKTTNKRPTFYVWHKDFNTGKLEPYDVLDRLFNNILTKTGKIVKKTFVIFDDKNYKVIPIMNKEQFYNYVSDEMQYMFWAKCEYEFITVDWPYREYDIVATDKKGLSHTTNDGLINDSHPVKIDMYEQMKPNMDLIVDIAWNYIVEKNPKYFTAGMLKKRMDDIQKELNKYKVM